MKRCRNACFALVMCGGWSACGAGGAAPVVAAAPEPVLVRGDRTASGTMGPAGGRLELSSGARIDIPAGALAREVEVTFNVGGRSHVFDNREDEAVVGPTLVCSPALVAQPGRHITISIPLETVPSGYGPEDVALVTEEIGVSQRAGVVGVTQTRWQYGTATLDGGRARAELTELAGMRLQFVVSR